MHVCILLLSLSYLFLCKGVISAIFKQDGNEDDLKEFLMFVHKKSANMSKFSLIILMGMSECWEAFFLSNLSMSFFMSSMSTSGKIFVCKCLYIYLHFFYHIELPKLSILLTLNKVGPSLMYQLTMITRKKCNLLNSVQEFIKIEACLLLAFFICLHSQLKVQSCKLYNNKYMITSTQITNIEIFAFIAVPVFELLNRKVLFINRKFNRNC